MPTLTSMSLPGFIFNGICQFFFFSFKGHVCLIVNVASKCGLTETNYKELNELYDKYGETYGNRFIVVFTLLVKCNGKIIKTLMLFLCLGLKILAFPCNQFNGQEPGNSEDICSFASHKKVQFLYYYSYRCS